MPEILASLDHIAYCGLYCGSCRSLRKGKCPGCHDNVKASWCKIRACCMERCFASCADCTDFENVRDCKKLNNIISKIFALAFKTNRPGSIESIRESGYDSFARAMAENGTMAVVK